MYLSDKCATRGTMLGHVDLLSRFVIQGWACDETKRIVPTVHVNEIMVEAHVIPSGWREDLVRVGHAGDAGFRMHLERALKDGDIVCLYCPDGSRITNTPMVFRSEGHGARESVWTPLLFQHIPKTAGTSLRTLLSSSAGPIESVYEDALHDPAVIEDLKQRKPEVLFGHFSYGVHHILRVPANYACMVRHPLERIKSLWQFLDFFSDSIINEKFETRPDLTAVVESGETVQTNNHMCRVIAGVGDDQGRLITDRWLLELAVHNLEHHYRFVGLAEEFSNDAGKISKLFGGSVLTASRENVSAFRIEPLTSRTIQIVEHYNALDMKLYEYALDRYRSRRDFLLSDLGSAASYERKS